MPKKEQFIYGNVY